MTKLTVRWSTRHEEARLDPTDRAALLARCNDIEALDFMKDTVALVNELYAEMVQRFQLRPKHDTEPPASPEAQT